jgi:O-methyltransferase
MYIIKKLINFILKGIGIDRINRLFKRADVRYEIARKGATYYNYYWHKAKKKIDLRDFNDFWETATRIIQDGKTEHYYDRLFVLWQAVQNLPSSDYPVVEVGTYKGGTAKFISEALRINGYRNKFFIFDTFDGHAVVDERWDGKHYVGNFSDTSYEDVKNYLNAPEISIHKGNFLETAQLIDQITNFGLVHIDVDVYPAIKFCLEFFEKHTMPGSIIVVDDYGNRQCRGAKMAVDEYAADNPHFQMFYFLSGQALLVKVQ